MPFIADIRRTGIGAVAAAAIALSGCQGTGGDAETLGTLGGAGAGALLGSQIGAGTGNTVATVLGAVGGALAGRALGERLDQRNQRRATLAEQSAVAQNQQVSWTDPETRTRGTVEPIRTFQTAQGNVCREYAHTVYIDGEPETATGVACRQADGTWRLQG
jgi:surface antigen